MQASNFLNTSDFNIDQVRINIQHNNRTGKETVVVSYGEGMNSLGFITPPCVTHWPRCTGDGNYRTGTYGAETLDKAQFTLDLSCNDINGSENVQMLEFQLAIIEKIDDAVLKFFFDNQAKLLGRRNLSLNEVKVLQIRASKEKINRDNGTVLGRSMNTSCKRTYWDAVGNKRDRSVSVCDMNGNIIENPQVFPGDIVAACIQLDHIYTGVGGDKFGCHWQLHDVCVVAQASRLPKPTMNPCFQNAEFSVLPYATQYEQLPDTEATFSATPMTVA